MTLEQLAELKQAVTVAKSQGITDTSALLKHLTERTQIGSTPQTVHHVKDTTRLQFEQLRNSTLAAYSLAWDATYDSIMASLQGAAAIAPDATGKLAIAEHTLIILGCYTRLKEIAPDGIWNGVAEWDTQDLVPVYGEPIISFGITGNDIEEVQRL